MDTLYATLRERRRPEEIAELLLNDAVFGFTATERTILDRAARHSLRKNA